MIRIEDFAYRMEIRGGGDIWRYQGIVFGHPRIADGDICLPSVPSDYDETNRILKTASGNEYHIASFGDDERKVVEQIRKDIKNHGFEIH